MNKKIQDFISAYQRRSWLENQLKLKLNNLSHFSSVEDKIKNRNCENLIGSIQVPLGIAGPIKVIRLKGNKVERYFLPLATTEGALVASVNRGAKATRLSGGIKVMVENVGCTRGPVFETSGIEQSVWFKNWLNKNFASLQKEAKKTSAHLTLKKLITRFIGKNVYVRFYFDTQEAMGMNMSTIATQKIVDYITKKTKVPCLSLSANFCLDKKPGFINSILGRGKRVWAESIIKKEIVKKVLKTTPEKIVKVVQAKCYLGSALAGSISFNAHFSNIVAALFLATGQDLGHVVEGSLGITSAQLNKQGDLYFSTYQPSLMLGTIGGGTGLATQKEALSILGIKPGEKGSSLKLAEIVGAAVLAGELSLLAALSSGDLALAHERLGRGGKKLI